MEDKNFLRLITLNIEFGRHTKEAQKFISEAEPDVLCLQELLEEDVGEWCGKFGMKAKFEPMVRGDFRKGSPELVAPGVAILSKHEMHDYKRYCYRGEEKELETTSSQITNEEQLLHCKYWAQRVKIVKNEIEYTIGNTHFTWSANGEPSDMQRGDLKKLLSFFGLENNLVFCGDFNAPRGREIFDKIASKYTDWVPKDIDTTLDPYLFRAKGIRYVVDGLFSTSQYKVENARVVYGVSDHAAIIGDIISHRM